MNESILVTIKKLLGIDATYAPFDMDVIIQINTALRAVNQLGIGVANFEITGADETWADLLGDNQAIFSLVKTYIYGKVRLVFDPPTSSSVMQALKEAIDECEWRLIELADGSGSGGGSGGGSGTDGYSPTVTITTITGGHRITITDVDGDHVFDVLDGRDGLKGDPGEDGNDGISPAVVVNEITGGHSVDITDAYGTTSFDVMDGTPGFSPIVSTEPITGGTQLTIESEDGTQVVDILDGAPGKDGEDGQDGNDGVSPTVNITEITGGHTVEITDVTGTSSFNVMDGLQGNAGETGNPGVYVGDTQPTDPDVTVWIDTSGEGDVINVPGTDVTITGVANTRYICGEVSTISITPPRSGIIDVIFTSGSSVAVLTVPNTVKWPSGFDPTSLETNTTYEMNIMDGVYGAVMTWT